MRAVRKALQGVEVVEVERPKGPGVRVKIDSSGICGSDLHLLHSEFELHSTLGHEMAGVTEDGTPVAIEPIRPCGACEWCLCGDYNRCVLGPEAVVGIGFDGGMAEEIVVPERCLVPLPAPVSTRDACLVEPLAVTVHGLRRAGLRGNQRVLVVGAGSIGLCAVAAIRAAGAEVSLLARHDAQREAGARLGASEPTGSYPLVIDASGTRDGLRDGLASCERGAKLLLVGSYWDGFELPGLELCMKEVDVIPSSMYSRAGAARDIDTAANVLAGNPEIARAIITHRMPLEAAPEAFAIAANRQAGAIKVVLEP
jgi:threonine dehydrogenase-like Zn-dependent dehydrogenase